MAGWGEDESKWFICKEFGVYWRVYAPDNYDEWRFPTFAEAHAFYLDKVTCKRIGPASGSRCTRGLGHAGWCAYADSGFK